MQTVPVMFINGLASCKLPRFPASSKVTRTSSPQDRRFSKHRIVASPKTWQTDPSQLFRATHPSQASLEVQNPETVANLAQHFSSSCLGLQHANIPVSTSKRPSVPIVVWTNGDQSDSSVDPSVWGVSESHRCPDRCPFTTPCESW